METIYLAGGCFWGLQKFFDQFDGVVATEVGYANGPNRPPTYTRAAIVTFPKDTSVLNMGVISR